MGRWGDGLQNQNMFGAKLRCTIVFCRQERIVARVQQQGNEKQSLFRTYLWWCPYSYNIQMPQCFLLFIYCFWNYSQIHLHFRAPQGGLEIPLSRRFFAQITPRNCLIHMFTPTLPNHAGCQIDHSRNNAIFFIQFPFLRSKICRTTLSRFPLGEPHLLLHPQTVP